MEELGVVLLLEGVPGSRLLSLPSLGKVSAFGTGYHTVLAARFKKLPKPRVQDPMFLGVSCSGIPAP